mmetsp:Transcript_38264/g.83385  ORF Transcript_38264/g.83385 Transcript_38264/m.83385 type:complete len:94 (-) Transcript_38264:690-971(-)
MNSTFAMLEATVSGIMDFKRGRQLFKTRQRCTVLLAGISLVISLLICTRLGVVFMDLLDYFVNSWGMLFVGFMEIFTISWIYNRDHRVQMGGE